MWDRQAQVLNPQAVLEVTCPCITLSKGRTSETARKEALAVAAVVAAAAAAAAQHAVLACEALFGVKEGSPMHGSCWRLWCELSACSLY